MNKNYYESVAEHRFYKKVIKTNYCWEWVGATLKSGYGAFKLLNKTIRAHRFSYTVNNGIIKKGLVIDHLCMNKKCVNPHHLEAVIHSENIKRWHKNKKLCV